MEEKRSFRLRSSKIQNSKFKIAASRLDSVFEHEAGDGVLEVAHGELAVGRLGHGGQGAQRAGDLGEDELVGEDVVRDVILNVLAPFKTRSGEYHLSSHYRYVIATT